MTFPYSESELRQQLCDIGRMMYERGFIGAADGNLAVRLDERRLLVTPAGCLKGFMVPEEMVITDLDGNSLGSGRPSTEIQMHVALLRERQDVSAVVHAHPPYCVAFSLAGIPLTRCIIPEIVVTIGNVPTVPYATPGTRELPDSLREPIRSADVLILERHGMVTVADELWSAFKLLDMVEHSAKIVHLALQLGPAQVLDQEQVAKLMQSRYDLGIESRNTLAQDMLARLACSTPITRPIPRKS
jgi:L-fuculose-phosphate aldolase